MPAHSHPVKESSSPESSSLCILEKSIDFKTKKRVLKGAELNLLKIKPNPNEMTQGVFARSLRCLPPFPGISLSVLPYFLFHIS